MPTTATSVWIPPDGVITHAGKPIAPDADFFVAPPIEIGKVISAYSTLTVSTHPVPPTQRVFRSLLRGLIFAVPTWIILMLIQLPPLFITLIVGAIATSITYFFILNFYHLCSYVGEQGIAEYILRNSRSAKPQGKVLCFKDAANLYTSQTRRYRNGAYQGTSYLYTWQMISGKPFELSGIHYGNKGLPDEKSHWHFANAAESVWSNHLLQVVNQQFQRLGYVEFPTKHGNPQAVRVGSGFLEFVLKDGSTQKVEVADMKDIKLQSGSFYFGHKDARWWSGKGKYEFMYSSLPNAQVFLLCLGQLAGVRWT